jgi:hypothetical protein
MHTYTMLPFIEMPEPDPRINYGRPVDVIVSQSVPCMVCNSTPSISFDTSEGEYISITLCENCIKIAFKGTPLWSNDGTVSMPRK